MLFCLEAERTWGGTGLSLGLRVANDCAGQFHRALVELAARFLVRACEAQFAQRIDDADSFGGRDGLRKVAANLHLFKGLRGGVRGGLCGLFAAAQRGRFVGEDFLRLRSEERCGGREGLSKVESRWCAVS